MMSYECIFVFFCLSNQNFEHSWLLHKCNSQSGNAIGHCAPSIALSPICESVFRCETHSLGLMGPCIPHLITNPMLRLWQSIYHHLHLGIHLVSSSVQWIVSWTWTMHSSTLWTRKFDALPYHTCSLYFITSNLMVTVQ
jgi:hypothetical protein